MDKIESLLNRKYNQSKPTNKVYLIAEEISKATGLSPTRWLRQVKKSEWCAVRALNDLKELFKTGNIKNRAGYFIWLYKKYEQEGKNA